MHQLLGVDREALVSAVEEAVATLSAQHLSARLDERDGVTVVVLGDDELEVELTDEVGSPASAAVAYRRVAATLLARAEMLDGEGPARNRGWT